MNWLDVYDLAIELEESYPDTDIVNLSFVKLQKMIEGLDGFLPNDTSCNEKVLEAVQQAWIEERE